MTGWANQMGRNSGRRRFPFGAWGVGLLTAGLGLLVGFLMPMAWIEEVSWQLYLDQLVAAARPPLGDTARLVAALLLAGGLGLVGWLAATFLGVRASDGGVAGWIAGLRGSRVDDEPDAPALRAADRHPDAPARRPFSATRDVEPVAEEPIVPAPDFAAEDADELLLDAHFDETVAAVTPDNAERLARWDALEQLDAADEQRVPDALPDPLVPTPSAVVENAAPVAPEPLDLSVARLDELIARLEAGLSRRAAVAVAPLADGLGDGAAAAVEVLPPEPVVARGGDVASEEPSFPQDPALAAALATLRRMNRAT